MIGKMSKCSPSLHAGIWWESWHDDDILLSGPRSLVDAVRNSLRKRFEIREQMLGAGPKNANEMIMLNRRVQWTKARIRISQDARQVKNIIEELGLEGATPENTQVIMNQSSGKVELVGNGPTRHSPRCIDHGKSSIKPERCGHGQTQKSGATSDWATNHLDALSMGGAIRQNHCIHGQ